MVRPLFLAALVLFAAGCSSARRSPHETAHAAALADSLGQTREAYALYRAAARRGDVWAQMRLGEHGRARRSLGDWLFEARPAPHEAALWAEVATTTAGALVADGSPEGHLAFVSIAMREAQDLKNAGAPAGVLLAAARRHAERAVSLGDRQALLTRAFVVWQADGSLAAEPFFREAASAGFPQAVEVLASVAYARPLLERGLRVQDAPGDLARVDVVGSIRVFQTSSLPEARTKGAGMVQAMRDQARAGSAEADSLLRALAAQDVRA